MGDGCARRRFLVLWLVLLPGCGFLVPSRVSADGRVELDTYRAVVDAAAAQVARADAAGVQLETAIEPLLSIAEVRFPDGACIVPDHADLMAMARAQPADPAPLLARLEALQASLEAWQPREGLPEALEGARRVLSRAEFDGWTRPQEAGLSQRLQDLIDSLLQRLAGVPWPRGLGGWLAGLGAVLLLGALSYAASALWFNVARPERRPRVETGGVPLTAVEARWRAEASAGVGDYRSGVRLLYLSTLLHLEERGDLLLDPAQTNREYLIQAAVRPGLRNRLQPVVDTFDWVWYGEIQPTADQYQTFARQVDRVREGDV